METSIVQAFIKSGRPVPMRAQGPTSTGTIVIGPPPFRSGQSKIGGTIDEITKSQRRL
jgi:hypothetical protein